MLLRLLLQTSLLLCWSQQTLPGGVGPQRLSRVGMLPVRGVGRPLGAHFGPGGDRTVGLGGRTGRYGAGAAGGPGPGFGSSLGTGFGAALGLGHRHKPAYGAGLGMLPGFGALGGPGYHGARPGYVGGAGNYLGQRPDTWSYAAGLRERARLSAAARSHAAAALGRGAFPQGYLGPVLGRGSAYRNGFSNGLRAALSGGASNGQFPGTHGAAAAAGLEPSGGKYGAAAARVPYGERPAIPAGLGGDGGYLFGAQQLGLSAEGSETTTKFGAAHGAQQTGEPAGRHGADHEPFGNDHRG